MAQRTLSLNEIASRIADAILEESFINKESIKKRVRPLLKIWVKATETPNLKNRRKTKFEKLQWTIERLKLENSFWVKEMKELVSDDKMKWHYFNRSKFLEDQGYEKHEEQEVNSVNFKISVSWCSECDPVQASQTYASTVEADYECKCGNEYSIPSKL